MIFNSNLISPCLDASCGKTSLIVAYACGQYQDQYVPTAFDDFSVEALVEGKMVSSLTKDFNIGRLWKLLSVLRPLYLPVKKSKSASSGDMPVAH